MLQVYNTTHRTVRLAIVEQHRWYNSIPRIKIIIIVCYKDKKTVSLLCGGMPLN